MTGLELALYARIHLGWAAMYDAEAEVAAVDGHADTAAGALARGLECRWLAAETNLRGDGHE